MQIIQDSLDRFAAIDGDVWQVTEAPVYLAPVVDDAPFTAPLTVAVASAPDTSDAAAEHGYFAADSYGEALRTMQETADHHMRGGSFDMISRSNLCTTRSARVVARCP
ncbi:hypothetical protein FB560_1835 [Microbacterium saperdae]|uniref:Uncharacterized protein n=1 Tax=Microbacterium saperdae TaxID=69368 RepID=A0A543BMZ0_9MICO|nr:hypothetical protein FB560_1835 [Microbacterium saperdae]